MGKDKRVRASATRPTARPKSALEPAMETETLALKPTRQSIAVRLVALAWAPCWRDRAAAVTPACE
jgi:hypothetical protein